MCIKLDIYVLIKYRPQKYHIIQQNSKQGNGLINVPFLQFVTWLTVMEYQCLKWPRIYVSLVISTSRSFPHSWLITGFVTRLARRAPLVELLTSQTFSAVRVTRFLILCVCFVDHCLSFCSFSFGHCVFCPSIYGFWLPPFDIFKLIPQIKNYHLPF